MVVDSAKMPSRLVQLGCGAVWLPAGAVAAAVRFSCFHELVPDSFARGSLAATYSDELRLLNLLKLLSLLLQSWIDSCTLRSGFSVDI